MGITNDNFESIPKDFAAIYAGGNGRLPSCALKSAPGVTAGITIHPQAAEQLGKLMIAAEQAGFGFRVSSGYRTYNTQVGLVGGDPRGTRRGVAAPGNSMHGWGTAVDIGQLYRLSLDVAAQFNRERKNNKTDWDHLDPAVHIYIRETSTLYKWLDENAPKYGWVNPRWARNGGDFDECWHWEYKVFSPSWPTTLPPSVIYKPTTTPVETKCGELSPTRTYYARTLTGETPPTPAISPYLATLESFHPNIQYELTRRRVSSETANTYTPFVRLTSLTKVYGDNLAGGSSAVLNYLVGGSTQKVIQGYCPSLGPHGQNFIDFNEIYYPQDNRSIVGFASKLKHSDSEDSPSQFEARVPLLATIEESIVGDQRNIPMPGIVDISMERSTAGPMGVRGGLMKADIKIVAYSVGQLDTMLLYFLRPATRLVLEIGRASSNPNEQIRPYDWSAPPSTIQRDFTLLTYDPGTQKQFIEEYVYGNNGNYEIFIGYVVKFDLKYTKDNVYEILLTVHSVQQFEITTTHTGVRSNCSDAVDKCKVMDIREYFNADLTWKPNSFKQLMNREEALANPEGRTTEQLNTAKGYANHFIAIRNPTTIDSGAGSRAAGLDEGEYFVSWQFFVEKILNDPERGIASIIPDDSPASTTRTTGTTEPETESLSPRRMLQLGLLRPVTPVRRSDIDDKIKKGLIANEVGYHPNLRSTDPNVMIINNPVAQNQFENSIERQQFTTLLDAAIIDTESRANFNNNTQLRDWIKNNNIVGTFDRVVSTESSQATSAYLENGVWLNTKAIKEAFTSTDTVTGALNLLLSKMNAATQGYWNLQLYSTDRQHSGLFVVDMGLSKESNVTNDRLNNTSIEPDNEVSGVDPLNSINKITKNRYMKVPGLPESGSKYIYKFNRGLRALDNDQQHIGSDLLDLNIQFNLPQVIAVQAIAGVGGGPPAQKSTLQSINIDELQSLNLIQNIYAPCDSGSICAEENCNTQTDNIDTRKKAWDEAQAALQNYKPAQLPAPPEDPSSPQWDEFIKKQQQIEEERLRLQQAVDSARSDYVNAQVQRSHGNSLVISTVAELSDLGMLLEFIEFNPSSMLKKLNKDSRNAEENRVQPFAHAFNSSNLTKTTVTLTMPGIGGIELWQSFLVDRAPSILNRGYYVVTKVIHKFSPQNGWITTIEGRFRYNPKNDVAQQPYSVKCEETPRTTAPATGGTPSSPTGRRSSGAAPFSPRPRNPDEQFDRQLSTMTTQQLYEMFIRYEEQVSPSLSERFGTSASREQWQRRADSGIADFARRRIEKVKLEMKKRINAGLRAGTGWPQEFRSLSEGRLNPREWGPPLARNAPFRGGGS